MLLVLCALTGGAATQALEVDVVVDLLLTVGRCFGEQNQQWPRVLQWFEGVAARSGVASFSFVTALLSSHQKNALREVLHSVGHASANNRSDDLSKRLEKVQSVFELNE